MISSKDNSKEGGFVKSRLPERTVNGRDEELLEMLSEIRELPDSIFWRESFLRCALSRKWTEEKMLSLGQKASDCGKDYAKEFAPGLAEGQMRELCARSGIVIGGFDMPLSSGLEIFALFETPNIISIRDDLLANCDDYAAGSGIYEALGSFVCEEIILAHEFFHYIEYRDEGSIFSSTYTEPSGLFKKQRTVSALGEIAAMSFAKELLGLEWNPFVLDCVMMSMNNMPAAKAIARRLIEFAAQDRGE